jgi:hypothetical protein
MWFELTRSGRTFGRTTELDEESENLDRTTMAKKIIPAEKLIKSSKMEESKNSKKWIIPVAVWRHLITYHTSSPDVVPDVPTTLIVDTYPCYGHGWVASLDSHCAYMGWTKNSQDPTYKSKYSFVINHC